MAWQSDQQERRTFDPETECELFVKLSFSDGVGSFRISGPEREIGFLAELDELSAAEKQRLALYDAIVWKVTSSKRLSDSEQLIVSNALESFELSHGLNPRGDFVFTRFGRGALFRV